MEYKIFGCKVNKYYTDKWLNSDYLKNKSGIFIASCVVTDKAKRKWLKFVRDNAKNLKGDEKMYISGCGAFKEGKAQEDFFELYPEIEKLKNKIEILGEDPNPSPELSLRARDQKIQNIQKKLQGIYTKKFILIQGGCDSYCTFCLTVIKRGRHFFRNKEDIKEEILAFEKQGGKEVVLTGVNLSAWGLETTNDIQNSRFSELLKYLLKHTHIPRIRMSSLGPEFINDECLEVFREERIYPHFHYSVQSGSSDILKKMKRHYDGGYIRELLLKTKNIQRKDGVDISLGADIIVGFPGETKAHFLETYDLIQEVGIQKLHVFPFSPHEMGESVPAGFFKNQISDTIKKERVNKIITLGDQIRQDFIQSQMGKSLKVLIESVQGDTWKGWSQNYIECNHQNFHIISGEIKRNSIVAGQIYPLKKTWGESYPQRFGS